MKNGIPSEKYYFLLDWKDKNMGMFKFLYGRKRLTDLSVAELNDLYNSATGKKPKFTIK